HGHLEIVRVLLAANGILVNQAFYNGATPLFMAAQIGHLEIVKLLLQLEMIDINAALNTNAELLTYFAAAQSESIRHKMHEFIQSTPDQANIQMTPEQIARVMGNDEIAQLLLQKKNEILLPVLSQLHE